MAVNLSRAVLLGAATIAFLSQAAWSAPIVLTDFNLIVGGNLLSNSEVEGRTLVGGNLSGSSSNYAVALTPSSDFSLVDTLIVGGNITAGNVNIAAGDVRVGGNATGNVNLNGVGSDLFENDGSVAAMVTSAMTGLNSLSAYLSGLSANSSVTDPAGPSAVVFNAIAGPGNMAVFDVNGSIFSNPDSQQYDLNLGVGVDLLVFNVAGLSINFNQGNFTAAFTSPAIRPYMIWNFEDATTIHLDRNWMGSLIAPNASLSNSTSIEGSVFVGGDFDQRGEVHLPLYRGGIPDSHVPEPGTVGLISTGLIAAVLWKGCRRSRGNSNRYADSPKHVTDRLTNEQPPFAPSASWRRRSR